MLHLIHQLLLQLRKDSFYFFFCIKMRSFFCVKSVHGSFFYYNTCLIISKTFSLRQKPCIYNLPVMCFSREKIWSSAVIIDFLQSFDNQKKTIGNFATYDPLMHCLSYKDHSRSYANHMFINHMISKLPIKFTVLLTYFNSNTFYKKYALLLLLYSYWWN